MSLKIDLNMVKEAREFLNSHVEKTPVRRARCLNGEVYFKCENFQKTGSFKIRGALNRMRFLDDNDKKKGVVAASAGNHAQGVALGAKIFQAPATIVMPQTAPMIKVLATQSYGANVVLHGDYYDQAYEKAQEIAKEEGATFIHPYQDQKVIAGQGTLALEMIEQLAEMGIQELDQVVVPIGGGGLIGGVAFVVKSLFPKCEVIGVVTDQATGMKELKEGQPPLERQRVSTIADGIAVKKPSPQMFENYISPYVDKVVAVSDNEIAEAIVNLMEKDKMIAEGSGAAGVAALLSGRCQIKGKCLVVVCGGNIDLNTMFSVIETGLRRKGRLTRLSVIVSDLPGELARMTALVAKCRANILDVMHDRVSSALSVRETRIDFLLETSSFEHAKEVEQEFIKAGIRVFQGDPT